MPISLQYSKHTAADARDTSMAGGDPLEKFKNRSYKGKSSTAINTSDLNMVIDTYSKMKGKPVIVSVNMNNPMVFAELEKRCQRDTCKFWCTGSGHFRYYFR